MLVGGEPVVWCVKEVTVDQRVWLLWRWTWIHLSPLPFLLTFLLWVGQWVPIIGCPAYFPTSALFNRFPTLLCSFLWTCVVVADYWCYSLCSTHYLPPLHTRTLTYCLRTAPTFTAPPHALHTSLDELLQCYCAAPHHTTHYTAAWVFCSTHYLHCTRYPHSSETMGDIIVPSKVFLVVWLCVI